MRFVLVVDIDVLFFSFVDLFRFFCELAGDGIYTEEEADLIVDKVDGDDGPSVSKSTVDSDCERGVGGSLDSCEARSIAFERSRLKFCAFCELVV